MNSDSVAKEMYEALESVVPFFAEDFSDGTPDGESCAGEDYRASFRKVIAAITKAKSVEGGTKQPTELELKQIEDAEFGLTNALTPNEWIEREREEGFVTEHTKPSELLKAYLAHLYRAGELAPSVEGWIATEESEFLIPSFLAAINDIGRYGFEKYKDQSFQARRISGDASRGDMERTLPHTISLHAIEHFEMYLRGEIHDHFHTLKHQLAAVAFNAMMEYYFAGFDVAVPPLVPTLRGGTCCCIATSDEGTVDSSRCSIHQPITPLIKVGQSFDFLPLVPTSSGSKTSCRPGTVPSGSDAAGNRFPEISSEQHQEALPATVGGVNSASRPTDGHLLPDSPIEPVGARERMYQILNRHREWPVFSPSQLRAMEIMITEFASSREEAVRELIPIGEEAVSYISRMGFVYPTDLRNRLRSALAKVKEEI